MRRCAESWRDGRFVLEQETNAYAVLPESQWHGYRPPPEPPAAPWPDTWGAMPPMLSAVVQAALESDPAAKAQVLAVSAMTPLEHALASFQRSILARELVRFTGVQRDAEKHSPDLKHTCNTGSDRSIEERKALMNKRRPGECAP